MFTPNKKIAFFCLLSLAFTTTGVIAQTTTSLEEDITITGESLQGIQTPSIEANDNYQRTPKLDVKIEPEPKTSDDGDVLFDGLVNKPKENKSPIYTLDKINTNQGDASGSQSGTIPLANF